MNILLLSRNRIIIEFTNIASKKLEAELKVMENIREMESRVYDIVIVDDQFSILSCQELISNSIQFNKSLLLSSKHSLDERCDYHLTKPFLPNDLIRAIEDINIGYQKSFLEMENAHTVKSLLKQIDKSTVDNEIESDDEVKISESFSMSSEDFIEMIKSVKAKKLKKILKGSNITITIKFERG